MRTSQLGIPPRSTTATLRRICCAGATALAVAAVVVLVSGPRPAGSQLPVGDAWTDASRPPDTTSVMSPIPAADSIDPSGSVAAGQRVDVTPAESATMVAGADWSAYRSIDEVRREHNFWWFRGADVSTELALVPDTAFGQVVRIRFPQSADGDRAVKLTARFGSLDKVWFRWRMRFSPGWTTVGTAPAGYANSYKIAFWLWDGFEGRGELEYSNTDDYLPFWYVKPEGESEYLDYQQIALPGSAPDFGRVGTEWNDGEWYEFVIFYDRLGPERARQHWWRRRLTTRGRIVDTYPWTYVGREFSGSAAPRVNGVMLGGNKNRNNTSTSYIYWGPWQVVDGSSAPNPWGMPLPR